MTSSGPIFDLDFDSIHVRANDFIRAGKKRRGVAVERHRRKIRRALMNLLQAAGIGPDTELTLRLCGKDILVSPTIHGSSPSALQEMDHKKFEQCLADVLARRTSALQRLAE